MGRKADWVIERELALRREPWTLKGPGRLVKVVDGSQTRESVGGYITTGIHLVGKTALQIRQALGLNTDYHGNGVRIYKLARLPHLDEYEYDLTAKFPGGLSYNPGSDNEAKYPEGSDKIPQWKVLDNQLIAVLPDSLTLHLAQRLSYDWLLK